MGLRKLLQVFFLVCLCVCLCMEQAYSDDKPVRKSRRKRRGCKCVQRYMSDVNKLIDGKLKEFKDVYLGGGHGAKKDGETQRMRDALLRLSGDVAETRNALRIMTSNMESMLEDITKNKKDYTHLSRRITHMGSAMGNLSKHVDKMEQRIRVRPSEIVSADVPDGNSSAEPKAMPTQCQDVFEQGGMRFRGDYYIMIKPQGVNHAFKALCKMVNNSGWTVVQKRQDGSVDFFRDWEDYRRGFGTLEGEFWLGNDNIHYLTYQEDTMLRIEMEDWNGKKYHAVYDHFRVDGHDQNYRLHVSGYHGNAGDALTSVWEDHDGMPFSTKDKDNDRRFYDSCAQHFKGGWWFNNCFEAHLNGKYYHKGFHMNYFQRDGIQWNTIHMYSSLKTVYMMIKPTDDIQKATASNEVINDV